MPIPKHLQSKADAGICIGCDREAELDSEGYCPSCLALGLHEMEEQGLVSIDWTECMFQLIKAIELDYMTLDFLLGKTDLSQADQNEIKDEYMRRKKCGKLDT